VNWTDVLPRELSRLETWPKVDRRSARRTKVGMTFRIWFDDMWLEPRTVRTKDWSKTGLYFVSLPANYRRGMRVQVAFGKGKQVNDDWRIPGRIVRVCKIPNSLYGIAIEFLGPYRP